MMERTKVDDELYLVLNLGLKSLRGIVFDRSGRVAFKAAHPIHSWVKGPFVEQEPGEWDAITDDILRELARDTLVARRIKAITVTASSACLLTVDRTGRSLTNAIMVSDTRATEEAALLSGWDVGAVLGRVTAYHMLPKILWIKRNLPEVAAAAAQYLSPNDYLIQRLCGAIATDAPNAQKYHYDARTARYPRELLRKAGIREHELPTVAPLGSCVGTIRRSVAEAFGLHHAAEVRLTSYDAMCAFVGSNPQQGVACDVSGTVTSVRMLCGPGNSRSGDALFVSSLDDDHPFVGGSNNLGGGLIEWLKQSFYADDHSPYESMESEAQEGGVGAGGLVFMPYLMGERAPIWDEDVRGAFLGIERIHGRKQFARSVFESTAYLTKALCDELEAQGHRVDRVRVSGGLSRVKLISQIKADVLGKDVEEMADFESTAIGALSIMLAGRGVYRTWSEAAGALTSVRAVYRPNPGNHAVYRRLLDLYRLAYLGTRDFHRERRRLIDDAVPLGQKNMENL